ncbi:hypothetical protein K469DRAFT_270263 [Zopfia rhizophila CBS 207.26]|uniref:Heterokaryon incompatibility domain-containing protein n=1 Tax=Zopfia rhizophila CBS 207.26 TaxID=1314779 RepID=A0A6A6DP78_9PEZI|nr:hypothetical protein K469DRAFT_270263 [Zopfia rhizophila CBS 207.26]
MKMDDGYLLPPPFSNNTTHLDCAIAGLCWRHVECCWTGSQTIRRRTEFPSWTWAGWAGTVTWTNLFTAETMDIKSLVDGFHCEFEDGTTLDLHRYNMQQHVSRPCTPRALRLSAWRVPPRMISLHGSESAPQWKIAEFVPELHVSYFEGNPSAFLEALREGQLEFIWVGKGLFHSYFLVVELHGASATRIGVGEAIFYRGKERYHRFAEDVRFETLKRDIYLI